jgi:hypothetical protein
MQTAARDEPVRHWPANSQQSIVWILHAGGCWIAFLHPVVL